MDRKIATIVGATAALIAAPAAAQASAATEAPAVSVAANYAELLEPIPNAMQQLKIADERDARFRDVQFSFQFGDRHDHHHHHDRGWYLRNGYMFFGGRWVTRDYYDHHHHHHHHSHDR